MQPSSGAVPAEPESSNGQPEEPGCRYRARPVCESDTEGEELATAIPQHLQTHDGISVGDWVHSYEGQRDDDADANKPFSATYSLYKVRAIRPSNGTQQQAELDLQWWQQTKNKNGQTMNVFVEMPYNCGEWVEHANALGPVKILAGPTYDCGIGETIVTADTRAIDVALRTDLREQEEEQMKQNGAAQFCQGGRTSTVKKTDKASEAKKKKKPTGEKRKHQEEGQANNKRTQCGTRSQR